MKIYLYLIAAFLLSASLNAQVTFPVNGPTDPRHITYAFTNAKIYTDYKSVIDNATLIIRDGLVVDAGANVTVPKDAVVYDLKGKCIYPSLIDMFTDYGVTEEKKPQPHDGTPQYQSNVKGAYNWNQAIHPEYDAFKNFTADSKKAEQWRNIGFGSVMSFNHDGIARGTGAFVMLGDGKENEMIVKDRITNNFSFSKGSSTQEYPGSLMGSIALIRQTYYDAQWYKSGGYKKEYNITLDAWNKLSDLPPVFDAGDKLNVLRANTIGQEFGVKYIIKAGGDEYQRINEIKETGAPLIVALNFPDAIDVSDPYDAMNISLAQLKHWELAPTNPAALDKAGITFALTAADLKEKKDFWKNLRKAIDNGLSQEDALKALTQTPAELLHVNDMVGSLKKGMLANFIVTSKNPFDKDNIIYDNWIKGVRYKINDADLKDIRGKFSVTVGSLPAIKMAVTGEANAPEVTVMEDTTKIKATYTRQGTLISLQYELKKANKGVYRLSGSVDDKVWKGNALLPSGEWAKWTAAFDSVYIAEAKKDTTKKDTSRIGTVTYPNMAYGWKELPKQKTVLFKNATVWTGEPEGILQNTDVLIANGRIQKIGKDLSSADAEVVDGTGRHLTAGVVDEHSHISSSGGVNEGSESASSEVRIGDILDCEDINVYRELAGGVTTSHILHGSANAIGGQTQLIKMRWGLAPEKLKFENWPGFIKFALGENVKQSNWGDRQKIRYPQSRMGVEQVYVDFFIRAREYDKARHLTPNPSPKERGAKVLPKGEDLGGSVPVRRDLKLEALAEILNGKRFITCHSYVQSEINMLMHVADTFGFRINTFTHILEGYKVADKMKAHGVLGVSTFSDWWAYKFEVYEAIPYNGALMHNAGLNVSFNSDDPEMARRLNQEAAKAVKYGGVSEEEAWKFVTLNPAKMMHVDDRIGSIRVGKDADLVLWNDNPLSIYTKPLQTYVDGIRYFDVDTDRQLREDIRSERARLMQKMTDAKTKGEATQKPAASGHVVHHCLDDEIIIMK